MSSDVIVDCRGVGKSYPSFDRPLQRLLQLLTGHEYRRGTQFRALEGVDFALRRGESVGIIGANGSGKSTLLQIIAGTLPPSSGSVATRGRIAALLELGAGFNAEFTGRENVYLNGALFGLSRQAIDSRIDSIAAFADIGGHFDMPVKTYSSGMYVRLAFAIAAHVDADTLVIDEALSVGDVRFGQKCMRFLRTFRERGSLLFVSHDPGAVVALCDRAVWLDRGRLKMDGPAKSVVERYLADQHALDRAATGDVVSTIAARPVAGRLATVDGDGIDPRLELLHGSSARNLLEVFHFEEPAESNAFGAGDARIVRVALRGPDGRAQALLLGGEMVELAIDFCAHADLSQPIVGFYVKDRLGQRLFGDNTFLSFRDSPMHVAAGQTLRASFRFRMPRMPSGDYSIDAAVATGTQDDHTQQHWLHDALSFRASDESMRSGLVGIPMLGIDMRVTSGE
jgi:lipopolysaccharide transport system ATP-binding protein